MSVTKELIEQERQQVQAGQYPEGAEQHVEGEKHIVVRLPEIMGFCEKAVVIDTKST